SRGSCDGLARSIGELLTVCSGFPLPTCSCCSQHCWPTTAPIAGFPCSPPRALLRSDRCKRHPWRDRRAPRASPPISARTRSDMRYVILAVVLAGAATLGGCSGGVFDPQGPIAAAERLIMLNATGIMLAIVIPTILATLGMAFWFRASNTRARYL